MFRELMGPAKIAAYTKGYTLREVSALRQRHARVFRELVTKAATDKLRGPMAVLVGDRKSDAKRAVITHERVCVVRV